jgi:lysophospholipase L1-like esterase
MMKLLTAGVAVLLASATLGSLLAAQEQDASQDWAKLAAYRDANRQVAAAPADARRIVFMGDSITEFWTPSFWSKSLVNRGISGQTTPQMLLRFRQDVIDLKPRAVVILAGTNDVAGNTGPVSEEAIVGNIASMAELAQAHGITVLLCAVLPADRFYWNPDLRPADKVVAVNQRLKDYAKRNRLVYVDYYEPMVNERKGLKKEYSDDGVHPNAAGYKLMTEMVTQGIVAATGISP